VVEIPWRDKKREEEDDLNPRDHNTEEENDLLDYAKERYELSRANKVDGSGENLHAKWREMDKLYRGDQWQANVPAHRSTPVINVAFAFIQALVPRLMDQAPDVLIMPRLSNQDHRIAELLMNVQGYLWYRNRMQKELTEATVASMKYGTSLLKTVWDPDALDEQGEVVYASIHPKNFFNDPRAYEIKQMEYCLTRIPKPLEYFTRRWPEKGYLVTESREISDTEGGRSSGALSEYSAPLMEYWFYDEEGNLCCMYYAEDVVFQIIGGEYDGSGEPVYRHNQFPFVKLDDYPIDKQFWSMGEIEIIESLQRLINAFESQIIDNTRKFGNHQWIVNKRASGLTEEDADVFNDVPGNVIFTQDGGVERVEAIGPPAHVQQHLQFLIQSAEYVSGIHDTTQGRRPEGVRTASAIVALQEAANIRVRQKARNFEYALVDLVDQANYLVLEHYDEPRKVRLTGTNEIVTLDVREALEERVLDEAAAAGIMQELGLAPHEMEQLPPEVMDEILKEMKFPEFDVEVHIGPSVPYSQALVHEQAKEYFQLNAIDQQALLESTNFPNWEQVMARMQQMQHREQVGERTFGGGPEGAGPGGLPGAGGPPPEGPPEGR